MYSKFCILFLLRYKIDGTLNIKFVRKLNNTEYIESILTDSTTQQYEINLKHNHKIDSKAKKYSSQ